MSRDVDVRLDSSAVRAYMVGSEMMALGHTVGRVVRDRARSGARAISDKSDAIIYEVGVDGAGVHVDVGYAKHHPGFYLWWWEVGTQNHAPRPHLRPALRPF